MTTTIVNDRDVLLQASEREVDPRANKYISLAVDTPFFHVDTNGLPTPSQITIKATTVNIGGGDIQFSIGAGTLAGTGDTRTLSFSDMPVDSVTVTATIYDLGQTYTATQIITKVEDGIAGNPGPAGAQYATAYLYKWASAQPALPQGTSTLAWNVGANTSYIGVDSWYTTVPANPGTPGVMLWVAQKQVSAPAGTQTTEIVYTVGASISAISQNGATGAPGVKQVRVTAYQWANGPAPSIAGYSTYTWAAGTYDYVPAGWSKTKPDAPALGFTLFEASVSLVDATGTAASGIDWTGAGIVGIGYMPTNGVQGPVGASAMVAYTLIDGNSLNASPATSTVAGQALPATGTWGETRAWQGSAPTPAVNQAVFMSNGVYNVVSNQTTWGVPYLANLRVGNLSSVADNTGTLTVSGTISSANGNFTVDANGVVTMRAAVIQDAAGNVIFGSGVALASTYAPAGTLNSAITVSSDGTLSGGGGGKVTIGGLGYTGDLNANRTTDTNQLTDSAGLGTKATWSNVTGAGKPADNATVGASFGVNIGGRIDSGNIANYVAGGAITNSYIGGDIQSTNWNGVTGTGGTGWYLERVGNFYANNVRLRGAIMGGNYNSYAWPSYGGGYYLGGEGLLLGNYNSGSYFQVDINGNLSAPGFSIQNGAATFSGSLSSPTITGGTITGGNISGGTVTGSTIKTAADGSRVEMGAGGIIAYGDAGAGLEQILSVNWGGIYFGSTKPGTSSNGIIGKSYSGTAISGFSIETANGGTGMEGVGNFIGMFGRAGGSGTGVVGQSQGTGIAIKGEGAASNFCFYAQSGGGGGYGPFTGSHDGLAEKGSEFEIGDIVVDVEIVRHHDVSNTIARNALSSKPNQKNVIGVYVGTKLLDENHVPAALEGEDIEQYAATYDSIMFNALGEGMVNVCGENGDIEAGDYITTSSIPGKGMRQADDLLRNYTVAKSRESVTFSSPTEVKMIACTYHCG